MVVDKNRQRVVRNSGFSNMLLFNPDNVNIGCQRFAIVIHKDQSVTSGTGRDFNGVFPGCSGKEDLVEVPVECSFRVPVGGFPDSPGLLLIAVEGKIDLRPGIRIDQSDRLLLSKSVPASFHKWRQGFVRAVKPCVKILL